MPRIPQARFLVAFIALALAFARPAAAQVDQYLGRPIAGVRLTIEGQTISDADLGNAVETRQGEPLSMAQVRESIVHLMALSRFENVRVDAQPSPAGVLLVYDLVPLRTVRSIAFSGRLELPESLLRSEVVERYGSSPQPGRRDDIARSLEDLYRDHGFLRTRVTARLANQTRADRATLTFEIEPGTQTRITKIHVEGDRGINQPELLRQLHVREGARYDPSQLSQDTSAFTDSMRGQGYYTARVDTAPRVSDDGETVALTITAERGPKVSVDIQGVTVSGHERDRLVPVASERSVDQDLLEDWTNNIEIYFRGQGYSRVSAPFERHTTADGQQLTIVFTVTLGPRYVLDSVGVQGNQFLSTADILGLLRLQPGQPLVDRTLEIGVATVAFRYRRDGFAIAAAKPVITTKSMSASEVRQAVMVNVTEGPRTLLRSVAVGCNGNGNGKCAIPETTLQSALTAPGPDGFSVTPGAPFYPPDLDRARDALLLQYLSRGYQLARVDLPPPEKMVSADRTAADVRFEIHEGPQILVDHILLVGTNRTKASTIRKELQVQPGEPLDLDKLAESQRRLTALGLFRRVRVTELQHGSETRRDLLVTVEEAPATSMTYGGGMEGGKRLRDVNGVAVPAVELAPRVLFDIGRRNLFGKNRVVNFSGAAVARPSQESTSLFGVGMWEYRAIGTYREPRIFPGADLMVTGGIDQAVRTSYSYNRRGIRAEVSHRLTPGITLYGRYSIERTKILNEQADVYQQVLIDRFLPNFRLSKFTGSVVRDTRDDPLDPSTGTMTSVELHVAPRALGSEIGFAKTIFQGFVYRRLPTGRRLVFAGGMHIGLARGFLGPLPDSSVVGRAVPISERFFSGNLVRGFVEDRLGTPDTVTPEGFPSGGNALLVFNGELRTSITNELAAVVFVDAGNVFGRISELSLREIRPSVGFGVRYKSPFGPFRLDIGFNPNRRIYGGNLEPLTSFYFGIGQAF